MFFPAMSIVVGPGGGLVVTQVTLVAHIEVCVGGLYVILQSPFAAVEVGADVAVEDGAVAVHPAGGDVPADEVEQGRLLVHSLAAVFGFNS